MKPNWEIKSLEEISIRIKDGLHKTPEYVIEGVPFISTTNLQPFSENFNFDSYVKYISKKSYKELFKNNKPLLGDVLISKCGTIGVSQLIRSNLDFGIFVGLALVTLKKEVDGKYFEYYLHSVSAQKEMDNLCTGTTRRTLALQALKKLKVPIPPISEQKHIVEILDKSFETIIKVKENAENNLKNAREIFNSYLESITADKVSLGTLVDIKTGKLDSNAAIKDGKYPFFTCSREIFAIDNFAFDCEAILLAGNNAVGDFNVKHYHGKFNAYQRTYILTVNQKNLVLYRYLYYQLLKSLSEFKQMSVGVGTKFLKIDMIKNMQISFPTLIEQQSIVKKLDSLLVETKKLEDIYQHKLNNLEELNKAILQKAFNGELTKD